MIPKIVSKEKILSFYNKFKKAVWISIVCLLAIFLIKGCLGKKPPKKEMPPRPVEIATAVEKDMPVYVDSFGNLAALNNVDIKSQVTGQITEVNFNEGDIVSKGDSLFVIDPRPYKAELDKQEAALAEDLSDLELKKITLQRNAKLIDKQLISQQDFDTYKTSVVSAEAKIKLDNALVETAKINLDYCYIRSPIEGITGKRQVDLGNIVSANTGPTLVNIKSIDPFYMDFTIPERYLVKLRQAMAARKLKVEIYIDGNDKSPYTGEVEFLDNAVDNYTGTIFLRATVSNKERSLWAGQFAKIRLILDTVRNAVIVPYEAVQLGQKGNYLFVITDDNKADLRLVTTGNRVGDLIVIEKGVEAGEKVATVGQMGLRPGVSVAEIEQQKTEDSE